MDYVVITIILFILGCSITYIVKEKRNGNKCIGCVHSKSCTSKCTTKSDMNNILNEIRNNNIS